MPHTPAPASSLWDSSAVGLSGLCLAHCLTLPVIAAGLPSLGALIQAHWVHVLFLVVALPVSVAALWRRPGSPRDLAIMTLAVVGLSLLAAGAFPARWPELDEQLTILGSALLVAAHVWNRRTAAIRATGRSSRRPPEAARR